MKLTVTYSRDDDYGLTVITIDTENMSSQGLYKLP